ncbi:uncharacterized protein LOC123887543 [Trifolium pratense]|uniref:uncharacterized protein LOC123887543 n=1 Tax=Trifolium pratense TaxID=57577 RepID=UPI001E696805|nr:uncharacterized protein LOC123887543 [Trifolium pratense]
MCWGEKEGKRQEQGGASRTIAILHFLYNQSHTSGLWVVEWMSMEHAFFVNAPQMLDENVVRMKVALRLLMGPHNDYFKSVSSNALSYWSKLINKGPENAKLEGTES